MNEIILINISGEDKPGLTSSITGILAHYDANILDIGQAVIHNTLSLGILVEVPEESGSSPILKEVLFKAHELDINIRFTPVSSKKYKNWVGSQKKQKHIITLLSRKITANQIHRVSAIIAENNLNIEALYRLSSRVDIDDKESLSRSSVEFSVSGISINESLMRQNFVELANELDIDIAFQIDNVYRRNRRLVVFDMDSTLIKTEVIDELAKEAGVEEKISTITERAMQGEMDFNESFKQRVAMLKGLDESVLKKISDRLPLSEGAERLVNTLKKLGYKTAILSGGFNYFGNHLKNKLGIDYVYANTLDIVDGKVTGKVIEPIVDGNRKAQLLKEIANKENIELEQVIAVGDGANDLPMLNLAGLGIAFRAKPIVKEKSKQSISQLGLDGILYLIGVRDRDHLHEGKTSS